MSTNPLNEPTGKRPITTCANDFKTQCILAMAQTQPRKHAAGKCFSAYSSDVAKPLCVPRFALNLIAARRDRSPYPGQLPYHLHSDLIRFNQAQRYSRSQSRASTFFVREFSFRGLHLMRHTPPARPPPGHAADRANVPGAMANKPCVNRVMGNAKNSTDSHKLRNALRYIHCSAPPPAWFTARTDCAPLMPSLALRAGFRQLHLPPS